MEGVERKRWCVDTIDDGFTISLKVAPGTRAPVHHHLGAIDVYVISGSIYYEKSDVGRAGDVILEPAGDIHRPVTEEGCELFCVFYGPIAGYDEEGNIAGIVDGKTMRAMAEEQGVAGHLDRHAH